MSNYVHSGLKKVSHIRSHNIPDKSALSHFLRLNHTANKTYQNSLILCLISIPFTIQWGWLFFILTSIGIVVLYLLIKKSFTLKIREKEQQIEQLNLERKLLISQSNPHFTFNTINSIQYYILENDKAGALKYLSDFAIFIRKSLNYSTLKSIPIKDEIDFLNLYLSLENRRFDLSFKIEYQIPKNIANTESVPALMLRPLIENVLLQAKHERQNENKILISINKNQNSLFIKVTDFEKRYPSTDFIKHNKDNCLKILRNRVKLLNGEYYSESDLSITSLENQGEQTVTIKLKEWKP